MNDKKIILLFVILLPMYIFPQYALNQAIITKYANPTDADYVIIGLGIAGSVMAKMLSDDLQTSVVALDDDKNLMQKNPNNIWSMYDIYYRGSNYRYAQWEALIGPDWSTHRIADIYKKLETYPAALSEINTEHSLLSAKSEELSTIAKKITASLGTITELIEFINYDNHGIKTGLYKHLPYMQDIHPNTFSFRAPQKLLNDQIINKSGYGVNGRKLTIIQNAIPLHALWDGTRAIGVEYCIDKEVKQIKATKGIIICAGLLSSAFLMRSGIGPRSVLESLHIPVIYDNVHVGSGLTNHLYIPLLFTTDPADSQKSLVNQHDIFHQIVSFSNPLEDKTIPIFHFIISNAFPGLNNSIPGLLFGSLILTPTSSTGTITIASSDPSDPPMIDLKTLNDLHDLQLYQNIFSITIKNLDEHLRAHYPGYGLIYPDPKILSDSQALTNFIKSAIQQSENFQGHCRMAPFNQGGVVDGMGRVYGVQNLFVADDSIVPMCIDGSPMTTAYLIAANIAQMILH